MPRVMRKIHEYYENRIIRGLEFSVVPDIVDPTKNMLRIAEGAAVVNEQLVTLTVPKILPVSEFIVNIMPANTEVDTRQRVDIVVLDTNGDIYVVHGEPSVIKMPDVPELSLLMAQVSIPRNWNGFVGSGANDEVIAIRSQHVIDTRFEEIP